MNSDAASTADRPHVIILVPTYNEAENVLLMLDRLVEIAGEIPDRRFSFLVVDDESPDGTGDLVEKYAQTQSRVSLYSKPKRGLGEAMKAGYKHAIGTLGADVVVTLDCDFQWDPADIPRLLEAIEQGADVAIGSRHTMGGSVEGWPVGRSLTHWIANYLFATWAAGTREVQDHTGNFRAIRVAGVLDRLDFDTLRGRGYGFLNLMVYELSKLGVRFCEVPIEFRWRERGEPKVSLTAKYARTFFRDTLEYIRLCVWIRRDRIELSRLGPDGWPMLLLIALSLPVILYGLGSYSVVNGDEGFYHQVAVNMVRTGNWTYLEYFGEHRVFDTFMNAPLQYWARASVISLFGDNYWTMRIWSALFGIGTILVTYRLGVHLSGRLAGLLAGLIQLTTLHFVYLHSARTGELETVVSFLFTSACLLFLRGLEPRGSFFPHHICLMLLVGVKLPVILIPVVAELACFALHPPARLRFRAWALGGLAVAPIGLAWHIFQAVELWEPLRAVAAGMAGRVGLDEGGGLRPLDNLGFYAGRILFGSFPVSLTYPFAIAGVLWSESKDARERWGTVLVFALAVFAFYTFVQQRYPWYVTPAYPLLAVFVGAWMAGLIREPSRVLGLAILGGLVAPLLWADVQLTSYNPFATLARHAPMTVDWVQRYGVTPVVGVPVASLLIAGAVFAMSRSADRRIVKVFAMAACTVLIGYGALRVTYPLRHTNHQSDMALLRKRIDQARDAGQHVRLPIPVQHQDLAARYYFAADFDLVPAHMNGGVVFLLQEKKPE